MPRKTIPQEIYEDEVARARALSRAFPKFARKSAQPETIDANAPPEPKIGDSLYYRGYHLNGWRAVTIIGETRVSWLIAEKGDHGLPQNIPHDKVAKDTLRLRGPDARGRITRYYTAAGMADEIWRTEHFEKIRAALHGAPVSVLKNIASLLHVSLSTVRK